MYELVRENLKACADYAHIQKLIFIDAEIFREEISDEFESFSEDMTIDEMLQMFSLDDKAHHWLTTALAEGYLAQQLSDFGCDGFLAQIRMPIWKQFEFESCLHTFESQLKWIYGSTIDNLILKMKKESELFFESQVNEAKKNAKTAKEN